MTFGRKVFLVYLIGVNLVAMVMYYVDKQKAKKHAWRISEAALMTVAGLGGAFGAYAGMQVFRHKTKHIRFTVGVPVCMVLWCVLMVVLWIKVL